MSKIKVVKYTQVCPEEDISKYTTKNALKMYLEKHGWIISNGSLYAKEGWHVEAS